ncbi:hypothetical protein PUMCH_003873 [Australozyma saopauloensis]|uniref:Helicase C-terminal domain-containing protein n=1 Tax=Australozyma saopauloensis TaxID=291208 RepID=A0AAX4HDR7_9ASCO|nr:hypothetical protein PUMCH_003873 [[Candida] saopauloensis]
MQHIRIDTDELADVPNQKKNASEQKLARSPSLDVSHQSKYRHFFLKHSVYSLNGKPLEVSMHNKERQLHSNDFKNAASDDVPLVRQKKGDYGIDAVVTNCDQLCDNLIAGGFRNSPTALLYSDSIFNEKRHFVMCARDTYDRSYFYLIPILKSVLPCDPSASSLADKAKKRHPTLVASTFRRKLRNSKSKVLILCPAEFIYFLYNRVVRLCENTTVTMSFVQPSSSINTLKKNVNIIISDPNDIKVAEDSKLLTSLDYLVFDHSDVLFRKYDNAHLESIVALLDSECHRSMILCSVSRKTLQFIGTHLEDYAAVFCGAYPSMSMFTRHTVMESSNESKLAKVAKIILSYPDTPIIIYVNDLNMKLTLVYELREMIKPTGAITAFSKTTRILVLKDSLTGLERESILSQFQNLSDAVLITSDSAAEEVDFKDIPVLISYDMPEDIGTFLERHGCVGQTPLLPRFYSFPHKSDQSLKTMHAALMRDWVDKEGFNKPSAISYSFFNEENKLIAAEMIKLLEECQEVVPSFLRDIASKASEPELRNMVRPYSIMYTHNASAPKIPALYKAPSPSTPPSILIFAGHESSRFREESDSRYLSNNLRLSNEDIDVLHRINQMSLESGSNLTFTLDPSRIIRFNNDGQADTREGDHEP